MKTEIQWRRNLNRKCEFLIYKDGADVRTPCDTPLHHVKADPNDPWCDEHLICPRCYSTYLVDEPIEVLK